MTINNIQHMKSFNVSRAELDDLLPELWEFCSVNFLEMHISPAGHTIDLVSRKEDKEELFATIFVLSVHDGYALMKDLEKEVK